MTFSGEACYNKDDCRLPNSVCSASAECDCNTADGYEDSNGSDDRGFCTKSLGRSDQ